MFWMKTLNEYIIDVLEIEMNAFVSLRTHLFHLFVSRYHLIERKGGGVSLSNQLYEKSMQNDFIAWILWQCRERALKYHILMIVIYERLLRGLLLGHPRLYPWGYSRGYPSGYPRVYRATNLDPKSCASNHLIKKNSYLVHLTSSMNFPSSAN